MTRFAWRQFRTQAAVAFSALAVLAVLLAITGPHLAHLYDISGISTCKPPSNCDALKSAFLSHDKLLQNLLGPFLLAVPALFGIFWGAPLVARELEAGTYRLAWTQASPAPAGWPSRLSSSGSPASQSPGCAAS